MVRSSLKSMNVPDVLWGESVNHVVYLLNRVNTKALKETTPYEMWTGRKPHVEHLRVFGCVAHMLIERSHLKKLEDRSKTVVHLGVEKGTKVYRLLDPDTGAMYVSRNVVFEETKTWAWEETRRIKRIPGISFTIAGFDLDEVNDVEIGSTPCTPDDHTHQMPQINMDWNASGS